jgi:hypothetical protein
MLNYAAEQVAMSGEGAAAFTDSTDQGGHFRTCVRYLCAELQSPPPLLANGDSATPLLIQTPNYCRGLGTGEDAAEKWVPNPDCSTDEDLSRFEFLGTLLGSAARFTAFMELDLISLVWKALLGEAIDFHELYSIDSQTAATLTAAVDSDDPDLWANAQVRVVLSRK